MKFEVGQTIKVEYSEGTYPEKKEVRKIGKIVEVTKRFIVIQYENYKESYIIADFKQYDIFIKLNKRWVQLKLKNKAKK